MRVRSMLNPLALGILAAGLAQPALAAPAKAPAKPAPRPTLNLPAKPAPKVETPPMWDHNVRAFGAKGDAKTDDTAAFQKAIDAAEAAGGGVVYVPRGDYLIKTRLTVKPHVTLMGVFHAPTARTQMKGSTLLAVDDKGGMAGEPFITLLANGTLKGLTIFYPEQSQTEPKPYPWTVRGIGDNCSIVDVLMTNPYAAVDFGTFPAGRHFIDGLYAQALYRGVFVDKCYDVGRIRNVHLWPFWTGALMKWTEANGEAFIIGRTDWEYIDNVFCIAYKVGFRFVANADGPGNAILTTCGSDIGPTAVIVESVQGHAGVTFVNGQFMAGIEVKSTNAGPVKFTASGFWPVEGVTGSHAVLEGTGQTSFSNCHFIGWDQKNENAPAIRVISGGLSVMGSDFMEPGKPHIVLEKGVEAATIVGNRFRGGQKVENASTGSVEIGLNAKM